MGNREEEGRSRAPARTDGQATSTRVLVATLLRMTAIESRFELKGKRDEI
jgi:hypothetical protein